METPTTAVKREKSINFGIVGSGQAGNRIAEAFYKLGYDCVAINTAQQDLKFIDIPESNKLLLSHGLGGAAAEPRRVTPRIGPRSASAKNRPWWARVKRTARGRRVAEARAWGRPKCPQRAGRLCHARGLAQPRARRPRPTRCAARCPAATMLAGGPAVPFRDGTDRDDLVDRAAGADRETRSPPLAEAPVTSPARSGGSRRRAPRRE